MSRRDPGETRGGVPVEPGTCRCGDIESVHLIHKGRRTSCSRSGCPCTTYDPTHGPSGITGHMCTRCRAGVDGCDRPECVCICHDDEYTPMEA